MDSTKPWYLSLGVWGPIVSVAATVASATGHPIPPEVVGDAANLITQGVAVAGGAVGLWGRIRATTRLSK